MGFVSSLLGLFKTQVSDPIPLVIEDNFPFAFSYVLQNEGGYSNSKDDRGGPTNFGITQADLSEWRGVAVTADDVEKMKVDEAKLIYKAWYWQKIGLDKIKSLAIATAIFDQGILDGVVTAEKYAQLAANNCGADLKVDGVIGPLTLAAFEKVDVAKFLNAFYLLLKSRFDAIVVGDATQKANYAGWMNRAKRLLTLA